MDGKASIKIALFLPSLAGGGAERIVLNLVRGFSNRGHKVDLVLVNAVGAYMKNIPDSVHLVDLGADRFLKSLFKLVSYLRKENPDVLISSLPPSNIIAIWAKIISRVPCRLFLRLDNPTSVVLKHMTQFKGLLIWKMIPLFYPFADGLIAVSCGVAEDIKKTLSYNDDNIHVIYNPIDIDSINRQAEMPLEHPWFKEGQPPVILGIGRLSKQKDFPTLIRAFNLVRKQRSARLVILGEGEERSTLGYLMREMKLENEIEMPGFVDNPYAYLAKASIFVLSSIYEGLSTVIIESLAVETPVVSTDCPTGNDEILDSGKYGLLEPVGEPEAMADAILKTLAQRPKKSFLQNRANDFSFDERINEYLNVLLKEV